METNSLHTTHSGEACNKHGDRQRSYKTVYIIAFLIFSIVYGGNSVLLLYWSGAEILDYAIWAAFFLFCTLSISMIEKIPLSVNIVARLLVVVAAALLIYWLCPWNWVIGLGGFAIHMIGTWIILGIFFAVMYLSVIILILFGAIVVRGRLLNFDHIVWIRIVVLLLAAAIAASVLFLCLSGLFGQLKPPDEVSVFIDGFLSCGCYSVVAYLTIKEVLRAPYTRENQLSKEYEVDNSSDDA